MHTLAIKLINLLKLPRATRGGFMDDHLFRHRGDKGISLHMYMCSYCCHGGNKLSNSSYTIRHYICINMYQNAKLSYVQSVQVEWWLFTELEGFLAVEVANSYQWLFISNCMLLFCFFCFFVDMGRQGTRGNKQSKKSTVKLLRRRKIGLQTHEARPQLVSVWGLGNFDIHCIVSCFCWFDWLQWLSVSGVSRCEIFSLPYRTCSVFICHQLQLSFKTRASDPAITSCSHLLYRIKTGFYNECLIFSIWISSCIPANIGIIHIKVTVFWSSQENQSLSLHACLLLALTY